MSEHISEEQQKAPVLMPQPLSGAEHLSRRSPRAGCTAARTCNQRACGGLWSRSLYPLNTCAGRSLCVLTRQYEPRQHSVSISTCHRFTHVLTRQYEPSQWETSFEHACREIAMRTHSAVRTSAT